ncbi:hypothetical protein SARC_16086, partial [Sphaeroforma arctica JP610]
PSADEKIKRSIVQVQMFGEIDKALLLVQAGSLAFDLQSKLQLAMQTVEKGLSEAPLHVQERKNAAKEKDNTLPSDMVLTFSMPLAAAQVTYGDVEFTGDTWVNKGIPCVRLQSTDTVLLVSR